MRCSSCGSDNREGRKFCAACGAELTLTCDACGAKNRPGERFCGECGKPLAEATKESAPLDPRSYTPKHLVEKILTSRSALEGERKQVTVLFADVRGSTELACELDPEEWHRIMDRFFEILAEGVHRFEGTVGAWDNALEALGTASTIGRERRLSYFEGGVLAVIAAGHLGPGDRARALATAQEAIAVCRRRGTRLWEFSALLTRIRALRESDGVDAARDIEAALAEADAWLEMSGAKSYEPFLHVERAELARLSGDEETRRREFREGHRLFLEIGAPIRAAELAKELDL